MSDQRKFPSPKDFADIAASRELSQYIKDGVARELPKVLRLVEETLRISTNQNIRMILHHQHYLIVPELKKILSSAGWNVVYTTICIESTGALEIEVRIFPRKHTDEDFADLPQWCLEL